MKMIVAIINDSHNDEVAQALLDTDFRATRLASTGGLLRGGTTTFMVGVEDDQVESALKVIRECIPAKEDPEKAQATLYVLNIRDFERL
ncbi:MAG: cyclic-di-AMP receptor [Anaerolineales bacterium]|nr:cyclic-di-AMP receptor [Chloroflexota bacterium]MBL6983211.1 cyclic-di-AMP receptor [Anaerolineales bacterium]